MSFTRIAFLACLVLAGSAKATLVTFEGLADNTVVPGGALSAFGVTNISGATSFIAISAGGSIPFANMPSPNTAIQADSNGAVLDIAGGFTGSVTVFYSANGSFNEVRVYSGAGATGTLLGSSATLVDNISRCGAGVNPGDPACWTLATVTFAGTGQSIRLPGFAGTFYYDNLTFTAAASPAPEPMMGGLAGAALLAGSILRRLRSRPKIGN